jgi:hypothetical protein
MLTTNVAVKQTNPTEKTSKYETDKAHLYLGTLDLKKANYNFSFFTFLL